MHHDHCCNASALTFHLLTQWRALRFEEGEKGIAPSEEPCRRQFEQVNFIMRRLRLEAADHLALKHWHYFASDWYLSPQHED